jgi:hypothetical protein
MVLPGHALADCRFHESGQRGQDVDRRVDLFVVHLAVDEYLALGDVAGEIRDRVGDVVVWHGQDRQLSD